jgi:hypothetical protein
MSFLVSFQLIRKYCAFPRKKKRKKSRKKCSAFGARIGLCDQATSAFCSRMGQFRIVALPPKTRYHRPEVAQSSDVQDRLHYLFKSNPEMKCRISRVSWGDNFWLLNIVPRGSYRYFICRQRHFHFLLVLQAGLGARLLEI